MTGSAARAGRLPCVLIALVVAGCGGLGEDRLEARRSVPLPGAGYRSLHVDAAGRLWSGRPDTLELLDSLGARLAPPVAVAGGVPRVVGEAGGRVYLRSGERVRVVDAATGAAGAEREEFGRSVLLPDVRGRYLFRGTPSGALLAHDPASLELRWAWGALAAPTTALAASPEGDRLYQALGGEEGGGRVLVRDLQTGRVLSDVHFPAPVHALAAGADGDLYGVIGEGDRRAVIALRPRAGELRLLWRRPLPWADGAEVGLRFAPGAGRLVVLAEGNETGLRVLDAEAGEVLGAESPSPRDAAVAPDGRVYLLDPGAVRLVRLGDG